MVEAMDLLSQLKRNPIGQFVMAIVRAIALICLVVFVIVLAMVGYILTVYSIDYLRTPDVTQAILKNPGVPLTSVVGGDRVCIFPSGEYILARLKRRFPNYSSNRYRDPEEPDWFIVSVDDKAKFLTINKVDPREVDLPPSQYCTLCGSDIRIALTRRESSIAATIKDQNLQSLCNVNFIDPANRGTKK